MHQEIIPTTGTPFYALAWSRNRDRIYQALGDRPPGVVVDIGCGDGGFAASLQGAYSHYIGIEPSDLPDCHDRRPITQPKNLLAHSDPGAPLPLAPASVNTVMLLASYDHIPDLGLVLPSAWEALKPGGRLLINMTNYGFWAKRLVNWITHGQRLRHTHDHYRVHTPTSLIAEMCQWLPHAEVDRVDADYWYLPRPPQRIAKVLPARAIALLEAGLRAVIHHFLRQRDSGSTMVVTLVKLHDAA